MPYSWQTLAGAQTDLAARLYDSGQQWWGPGQLTACILEALRTWNALTSFWRQDMVVSLVTSTWWYDIAAASGSVVRWAAYAPDNTGSSGSYVGFQLIP